MVAHACDPSSWEDCEFKVSLGYIKTPVSQKQQNQVKSQSKKKDGNNEKWILKNRGLTK
jgi:hypothetical protein